MAVRLGDLLVSSGTITEDQRDLVLEDQRRSGRPFGEIAERLFGVRPTAVEQAWADQFAMITTVVDPCTSDVDKDVLPLIDRRQAWQFRIVPLWHHDGDLVLCTSREHLVRALKFAGWRLGRSCHFVLAEPQSLSAALTKYYNIPGMEQADAGRSLRVI